MQAVLRGQDDQDLANLYFSIHQKGECIAGNVRLEQLVLTVVLDQFCAAGEEDVT